MTNDVTLLREHLRDLEGLYARLDNDSPSRQRVFDRIEECKQDIIKHQKGAKA